MLTSIKEKEAPESIKNDTGCPNSLHFRNKPPSLFTCKIQLGLSELPVELLAPQSTVNSLTEPLQFALILDSLSWYDPLPDTQST